MWFTLSETRCRAACKRSTSRAAWIIPFSQRKADGVDFEFDEDQLGLQAAAADVLAKECPAAYLRSVVDDGHDASDLWATSCALDWPGLAIADRRRRRRVRPFRRAGDRAGAARLRRRPHAVPGHHHAVRAGRRRLRRRRAAAAVPRRRSPPRAGSARWPLAGPARHAGTRPLPPVEARRTGAGGRCSGTAAFVVDGDRADEIAVLARTARRRRWRSSCRPTRSTPAARPPFDEALHRAPT